MGEVCPTIEYLSHLSSFNKHTYSALESFWTTYCQFIKPSRLYSIYHLHTSVTAWCPVQALHRWGVWPFLHSSISPLLHPPRKYLLTFYTAAAALHLCRCRHRVWFPATATSHSSLAVSFSQPESLHLNWRGWHPDLEVGREMLRCLNPDQNKQLSLTHGYEWGLIFGSQHRIRVSSTTSGAGPGFPSDYWWVCRGWGMRSISRNTTKLCSRFAVGDFELNHWITQTTVLAWLLICTQTQYLIMMNWTNDKYLFAPSVEDTPDNTHL